MIEQLRRKARDAGESRARQPIDGVGDGDDFVRRKTALMTAIERIARRNDASQDGLGPPQPRGRRSRLCGLFQAEHRPVIGRHRRRRVGFLAWNLDEVADMTEAETRPAHGPRAFHVDGDRSVDAAPGDSAAERAVASHLFGHRIGFEAELRRDARYRPGVALDGVEVDHIAVGGNFAGLMQRDRLFNQRGIAATDETRET